MKLHLTLGGVDVDVHRGGVYFQKKAGDGIAPFHQCGVIALEQREVQPSVLHRTPVYEEVLVFAGGAGHAGCADETPDVEVWRPKPRV